MCAQEHCMIATARRPWRRHRLRPAVREAWSRCALLTTMAPNLPGKHYPAPDVQQFVPYLYPPGTPQPTRDRGQARIVRRQGLSADTPSGPESSTRRPSRSTASASR